MEDQYQSLLNYVAKEYPPGYTKSQNYVVLAKATLWRENSYVDKRKDGSTFNRLVIRGREEAERVFMECHLTAEGTGVGMPLLAR